VPVVCLDDRHFVIAVASNYVVNAHKNTSSYNTRYTVNDEIEFYPTTRKSCIMRPTNINGLYGTHTTCLWCIAFGKLFDEPLCLHSSYIEALISKNIFMNDK